MLDEMRRRTEDIIRYYGELNRRIEGTGLGSLARLLERSKQIELAMHEVGSDELGWVAEEMKRLLDDLVHMDARLERLRQLKTALDGPPEPEEAPRSRSLL